MIEIYTCQNCEIKSADKSKFSKSFDNKRHTSNLLCNKCFDKQYD